MSETPIYDNLNTPKPVDKTPQPKVVAATIGAGVGAAIGNIIVWIVEAAAKIDIPDSVELSIGVVITAALTFVAGYVKKN